jgi:hypothetical protein
MYSTDEFKEDKERKQDIISINYRRIPTRQIDHKGMTLKTDISFYCL